MIIVRVVLARQVERLDVWFAAVVDESRFVSVKLSVEAEREELVLVSLLDQLLFGTVVRCWHIVHVEQIRKPARIVKCAAHVPLLFRDHFARILH